MNDTQKTVLETLREEWSAVNDEIRWSQDQFHKARNYLFLTLAALFGLTGAVTGGIGAAKAGESIADHVWVLVSPFLLITMAHILRHLEYGNQKARRRIEIEALIAMLPDCKGLYRLGHTLREGPRVITAFSLSQLILTVVSFSVLVYAEIRVFDFLHSPWRYLHVVTTFLFAVFWSLLAVRLIRKVAAEGI